MGLVFLFWLGQIFSFAVLSLKYAQLAPFGNQRRATMSKCVFNCTVPTEWGKGHWNSAFIIWFFGFSAKSNSFNFVLRPSFLNLLPKVVFRTAVFQSYPLFDMLGVPGPANEINSSRLDYTGIDWRKHCNPFSLESPNSWGRFQPTEPEISNVQVSE